MPNRPPGIPRRTTAACLLATLPWLCGGCSAFVRQGPSAPLPNPLEIPVSDREFTWNVIVDTVDDYFTILKEDRVRLVGDVLTEGRIETVPLEGAAAWEFWRKDRTPGFEAWHGTFQSIRRRAEVTVSPSRTGYGVTVVVRKELEDLARPEMAMAGGTIMRYDGGLVRPRGPRVGGAVPLGWIALGRDVALEQKILADLHRRFYQLEPPSDIQLLHR